MPSRPSGRFGTDRRVATLLAMFKVTRGAIEMTWDPEARVATLAFTRDAHVTGADAAVLVENLSQWIGGDHERFALLGDGGRLRGVDAEYRATWARFFKAHRHDSFIAFFNMGPFVRVAAEMFRLGARLQLKAFATEEEARAWLRDRGIDA
jgi:hypothetical protein